MSVATVVVVDPVALLLSLATSWSDALVNVVSTVNEVVATPDALVVEVSGANAPPAPTRTHVTTRPAVGVRFPKPSVSWADTVTVDPTTSGPAIGATEYFEPLPAV